MDKKKVLFVVEKIYGGGVENIARTILKNWDYEKYDVTLCTFCQQDVSSLTSYLPIKYKYILHEFCESDNILRRLAIKLLNKTKLLVYYHFPSKIFTAVFFNWNYDVAIAFIEGYATRVVAGMSRIKKRIAWLHTDFSGNHWTKVAYRNLNEEKQCYSAFDKVVCVSQKVAFSAGRILDLKKEPMVLYNPIDVEQIRRLAQESIDIANQNQKDILKIVTLGNLIEVKGYKRLLSAFSKLLKSGVEAELYILGHGPLYGDLSQCAESLGLSGKVHFEGFVENPYPYLKMADIYVCSSFAEGFNTAITEALILGRPVVATACSGVDEQLGKNNDYGIMVENTEEGLFRGIISMTDPDVRYHYSRKAIESSCRFNLRDNTDRIYSVIEE